MFPPVARRRLLTIAAGGAVAAAIPAVPLMAAEPDPIFAAIQVCRAAKQASDDAYARVNQLMERAIERFGSGREQFEARNAFVEDILGEHPDDHGGGPAIALWEGYEAFAATVPTTLAGLFAMLAFAGEVADREPDALNDFGILSTFAAAAMSLSKGGAA